MWILAILGGAIGTAVSAAFFRANPLQLGLWTMVLAMLPLTLLTQQAFAFAFNRAPSFFMAWFLGSGLCAICAFLVTFLVFREEEVHFLQAVGIGLILLGAGLLLAGP
jgi:hypothetical protein